MKTKRFTPPQAKLEMRRPDDDRPPLPEAWRYVPVSEILDIQYGKGLTKSSRDESGSIPVYGSNGIVGYHNLNTQHRAVYERHKPGELFPNFEYNDSKSRWEYKESK